MAEPEKELSDDELFELPNPDNNSRNSDLGTKDDDDSENDDAVIKIDPSLLIDINLLSIGTIISESHYSIVYDGLYNSMPIAIKVIQPSNTSAVSPERKDKFQKEITMLARVKHENIVKFIGACVEPSMMLITELMSGGTLQKYLWSIRPKCLDLKVSISFALEISDAMEYLHGTGIIHRDLKPTNLLLTEDKKQIKLADFGVARDEAADEMTTEAGTYRWMAPELFSKEPIRKGVKKHYDHKVDVYSFSLVLWELITNITPYKGRNNVMVAYAASKNERPSLENLPKDIVPFLKSCWAENPTHRPEFMEITPFLSKLLHSLSSTEATTPPMLVHTDNSRNNVVEVAAETGNGINKSEEKGYKSRSTSTFLCCLNGCLSD